MPQSFPIQEWPGPFPLVKETTPTAHADMLTTCYYKRKELKKEAEKRMEKRMGENRQDSRRAVCQGERGINWRTAPPFLCRVLLYKR